MVINKKSSKKVSTFGQRLEKAVQIRGDIPVKYQGRNACIATAIGVTPKTVQKYFSGESIASAPKMAALARYLNVDLEWLATGEGFPEAKSTQSETTNTETLQIINEIRNLDKKGIPAWGTKLLKNAINTIKNDEG